MNALDSRIRELVAYARERDGEDRTALFRNLVDLFLTKKAPTKQPTRSQLLEVVNALIPHVDPESRRTVSDLLASMNNPPMDLIHCIVKDRASLVSKLLKTAPFDEDELIELIEITGREHHQELASRTDLSANVWIALARATPAAPPYGSNSTLALWREDLGQNGNLGQLNTGKKPDLSAIPQNDLASVTPLHPEKHQKSNARIRILRTDEDIVTSHLSDIKEYDPISFVKDEDIEDTAKTSIDTQPDAITNEADESSCAKGLEDTARETQEFPEHSTAEIKKPAFKTLTPKSIEPLVDGERKNKTVNKPDVIKRPLIEPEAGSWAWRSDRDGFIIEVSSQAQKLMSEEYELVGAAMLDMLALNSKLGHPVSRAFQKRSSIHEAPIYLSHLEQTQRYWTLEAAPLFNPNSGAFDGYEGILEPVIPARGEDDIIPADESGPDTPDYLASEHTDQQQRSHVLNEASKTSNDSITPNKPLSWFDEPGLGGRESSIPQTKVEKKPSNKPVLEKLLDDPNDVEKILNEAVTLKTAITENSPSVGISDQENKGGTTQPDHTDLNKEPDRAADDDMSPKPSGSLKTIESTLELMDEALKRLAQAEHENSPLQIRLQAEIAQACARTLKSEFDLLKQDK
jgi:hypothetical protein